MLRNELGQFIKVKKINIMCPNCNMISEVYPSDFKRGRRFCSYDCAMEYQSKYYRGDKHHRYVRVLSICQECGKFFSHLPSKLRQYCSNICANINNTNTPSGEANYNWKGGRTSLVRRLRNSDEYKIWREFVFARDNYTCRICGATRKLNPHHIVPISKDITKIFEVSNGITLCVDCHQEKHPELKLTLRGW